MPKGIHTQGLVVLLGGDFQPSELIDGWFELLDEFADARRVDAADDWPFGGPGVVIDYRPEVNGTVLVDVVDHPWPDEMGDPQSGAMVFGAWTLGAFGPCTFPGNLERALDQSWAWPEGPETAAKATGFARIRSSYVLTSDGDAPCMPDDYDPMSELMYLTSIARALLDDPRALCLFTPGGEVLSKPEQIDALFARLEEGGPPPLELWCNVRLFDIGDGWNLMDSVGMEQLDIRDHTAAFPGDRFDPDDVAIFLRNISLYVLASGDDLISDGDTCDGPGEAVWRAMWCEDSLVPAPRPVVRWLPADIDDPPEVVLGRGEPDNEGD